MAEEKRFRRLLRWYPRAWRERNGTILLGTMLDDAERQGRSRPSLSEQFSAAVYGLGTRLDGRLAQVAALAALGVALLCGGLIWGMTSWAVPALLVVAAALIAVGTVALARERCVISEPRALLVLLLALSALAFAALANAAWSQGFDAADQGIELTGLATAWVWLFGLTSAFSVAAIALFMDAVLQRAALPSAARVTLAILAALLLTPVIGLSLTSPVSSILGAGGLTLLTQLPARRLRREAASAPVRTVPEELPSRTRRLARQLACVTAIMSTAGVAYALTGAGWSAHGDATRAMGQGISVSLLAAPPLLAAIGLLVIARGRVRSAQVWGPLLLVALSLVAVAVAYLDAPAGDGLTIGMAIGSTLGGAALAWWILPRLPGSLKTRIAIAVPACLVYAYLGMFTIPLVAFALPLLAVAFAIWAPRPRRERQPHTDPVPGLA